MTFTQLEAEACIVVRCESVQSDSVHTHYVFAVTDNTGEYYEWVDNELVTGATQTNIKESVIAKLQTIEKRVPGPVIAYVADNTGVIGSTVSSL